MHIRDMTLGDEEPIQHVADTTWRSTYAGIFSREFIDEFLDKNYSPYVLRRAMTLAVERIDRLGHVAVDLSGKIVGYSFLNSTDDGFQMFSLDVLPNHQRRGVGAAMLRRAEEWLRDRGASGYHLFVHSLNETGKSFYRKHGFAHDNERDTEDEWCMSKALV